MKDKKEFSALKWVMIFITSIIMGILIYLFMVKMIFNPSLEKTPALALQILKNIGHPMLKLKAYVALFSLIAPLLVSILWYLMPNLISRETYGNARFARKSDFKAMNINYEKGLVLGALNSSGKFKFLRGTLPLSALIVAPPGKGKTSGIIIPNLLLVPNTTIVYDIKGELYQKTAGYRQKYFKNEIQVFSPFSWDNTLFFNPFDNSIVKDMEYIHIKKLAEQIASTIFITEKGKENDHWVISARTMFVFFAEYFLQKDKHATLSQLAQAPKMDYIDYLDEKFGEEALMDEDEDNPDLTKPRERDYDADTFSIWLKQTSFDESIDENTRNQARTYAKAAENEFASIKSTYDTFMKVFSNPQVANATSKMSFSFEDLRNKRITLYVVIQTIDMDVLAPLVRIFTETLLKHLMSGAEYSDPNTFIYAYFDEFVRFKRMEFLLEAPALCRSYGFIPVFVTQSYEQIRKYYGEDDLGIIRANVGYQIVFAMNTTKDAKDLSELIGDFTRKKTNVSKGNLDLLKSNQSVSQEAYKLVTEQDIKNQSNDELLILVTGHSKHPIKAKVPYWFKNPEWKGVDKIEVKIEQEENENLKVDFNNKQELLKSLKIKIEKE